MNDPVSPEVVAIQAEIERLNQLENLLNTGNGKPAKFLKSELHRLANEVRRNYRKIDMRGEHAGLEVNTAQAFENAYNGLLDWISQSGEEINSQKKELDMRMQIVLNPQYEETAEPLRRGDNPL